MRTISIVLLLGLAPSALSKAIPDSKSIRYKSKPAEINTSDWAKVTWVAKLKRSDDDSLKNCLTMDVVEGIIDDYTYLMTQPGKNPDVFNTTAEKLLTDDFTVLSESILTLGNIPLEKARPAYQGRASLIDGQFRPDVAVPILKTLDVFFSCSKIAWRWEASGLGSNVHPVKGMITFDVVPDEDDGSFPAQTQTATTTTLVEVPSPAVASESTTDSPSAASDAISNPSTSTNDTATTEGPTPTTTADQTAPTSSASDASQDSDPAAVNVKVKRDVDGSEGQAVQWRVRKVFSEFNTGAWIKDIGGDCAAPAQGGQ